VDVNLWDYRQVLVPCLMKGGGWCLLELRMQERLLCSYNNEWDFPGEIRKVSEPAVWLVTDPALTFVHVPIGSLTLLERQGLQGRIKQHALDARAQCSSSLLTEAKTSS